MAVGPCRCLPCRRCRCRRWCLRAVGPSPCCWLLPKTFRSTAPSILAPSHAGVLYNATIVPCAASLAVVNMGQAEAKVEALFSEFVQLRCALLRCAVPCCDVKAKLEVLFSSCVAAAVLWLRCGAVCRAAPFSRLHRLLPRHPRSPAAAASAPLTSCWLLPLHCAGKTRASPLLIQTWAAWWVLTTMKTMRSRMRARRMAPAAQPRRVRWLCWLWVLLWRGLVLLERWGGVAVVQSRQAGQ